MNLLALIFGLLIERLITQVLHLREPRWMDRYFDWGLFRVGKLNAWQGALAAAAIIALPVLPVLLISVVVKPLLFSLIYLGFAIVVLIFSLGPRDLQEDVDDYCAALSADDQDAADRIAKGLTEIDLPMDRNQRELAVEEAVLVQADNRLFAVVFWFAVLGPVGAWMFRVSDLFRRRRAFELSRSDEESEETRSEPVLWWHGVLVWLPARLQVLGYGLAGSFDGAMAGWKIYYKNDHSALPFYLRTRELLATVGRCALEHIRDELETDDRRVRTARGAYRLVRRSLLVWVFGIAVLTLLGLLV